MPIKKDGRRTPKEVIESVKNLELEESWIKLPRQEPVPNSTKRSKHSGEYDDNTYANSLQRATGVHTHPLSRMEKFLGHQPMNHFPSGTDLKDLLSTPNKKAEVIASVDVGKGQMLGYTVIRKTKITPLVNYEQQGKSFFNLWRRQANSPEQEDIDFYRLGIKLGPLEAEKRLKSFCNKYHLQYKYIPVRDKIELPRSNGKSIETKQLAASIALIFGGILFSSFGITGNIIGTINKPYSILGAILFIAGIVYLYSKRKEN